MERTSENKGLMHMDNSVMGSGGIGWEEVKKAIRGINGNGKYK